MKKYFIFDGKEQKGPLSAEELKSLNLTDNTMVWFDGLSNWTEAKHISELKDYFVASPPPFVKPNTLNQKFDKAKKAIDKDYVNEIENKIASHKGRRFFKYTLILLSIFGIAFIINLLMPTEGRKERNNPSDYLVLGKGTMLKHIDPSSFWDKEPLFWAIDGTITNKAKLTTYKDVKLEIEYFTVTNTFLGKDVFTVVKAFPPNAMHEGFEDKTYFRVHLDKEPPQTTDRDHCKIKIIDADIYKEETANN